MYTKVLTAAAPRTPLENIAAKAVFTIAAIPQKTA